MTGKELEKKYLAWWQPLNHKGRLFRNNSGGMKTANGFMKFGVPPGGGGSDLIGLSNGIFIARELKTINDTLKEKQANFLSLVKILGGDAGLIMENQDSELGFDEIIWNENLRYLIKG